MKDKTLKLFIKKKFNKTFNSNNIKKALSNIAEEVLFIVFICTIIVLIPWLIAKGITLVGLSNGLGIKELMSSTILFGLCGTIVLTIISTVTKKINRLKNEYKYFKEDEESKDE